MLDVFLMLGTLLPIAVGHFCFSESIGVRQVLGFVLLLAAVLIMCSYNNAIKVKLDLPSVLLLIACGAANGVTSASQKAFVRIFSDIPVSLFNFLTYVFAALTLVAVFFLMPKREEVSFSVAERKKQHLYIGVMALALTLHSYFTTVAALYLDSARLYPLSQGASLVLSTLMAALFFGEKLTLKAVVGIITAFAALLIINL